MDQLFDYLLKQTEKHMNDRKEKVSGIKTGEEFYERQSGLKEIFSPMIGFEKHENYRFNVVKTGVSGCDGYHIEKLLMEPEPGYFIPANLYIPENIQFPRPAVLTPIGHYDEGKNKDTYQIMCASLALKGYVVLIFDPIGQGERDLFLAAGGGRQYNCVVQHSLVGNLAYLTGESIVHLFIRECIYAIDYLFTRPEVDSSRIACTGQSGGGTITAFLASVEDRIKVAVPIHFMTTYYRIIRDVLHGGDPDQSLFALMSNGIDMHDFIWMAAPKPYMMNAALRDFFPIDGTREVYAEMKEYYSLLGFPGKLHLAESDCEHMITREVREHVYKWINKWFDPDCENSEPEVEVLPEEKLNCTGSGNVCELSGITPFDIFRAEFDRLEKSREEYRQIFRDRGFNEFGKRVAAKADELLGVDACKANGLSGVKTCGTDGLTGVKACNTDNPTGVRTCGTDGLTGIKASDTGSSFAITVKDVGKNSSGSFTAEEMSVVTEEGIDICCKLYQPSCRTAGTADTGLKTENCRDIQTCCNVEGKPLIFSVDFAGCLDEGNGFIEKLLEAGYPVAIVKPRGFDVTKASNINDRAVYNDDNKISYHSLINSGSVIGMRVYDCIKVLEYLRGRDDILIGDAIFLGTGQGGLIGMFAGLFDDRIKGVVSISAPASYGMYFGSKDYIMHPSNIVNGFVRHFDMDIIAACCAPGPLVLINPLDELNKVMRDSKRLDRIYGFTAEVYAKLGFSDRFITATGRGDAVEYAFECIESLF